MVTCRYAESDGNFATIVGAGTDVLQVPAVPHLVAIMVAVRLTAQFEEVAQQQQHAFTVRVAGPDGRPTRTPEGGEAPDLIVRFRADQAHQRVADWLVVPTFALAVQWWADREGAYTIEVGAGEGDPVSTPVHVLTSESSEPA